MERIFDRYKFLITLDHKTELGKKSQNSNGKTDGFIKLLTKDQDQQELITWD